METTIDFSLASIEVTDFDLKVTDTNKAYWAVIESAKGSFSSTDPVFNLDTTTGTWEMKHDANVFTVNKKSASGSFFGDQANNPIGMGGNFGMMDTANGVGVAGIFQGGDPGEVESYTMYEEGYFTAMVSDIEGTSSDSSDDTLEGIFMNQTRTDFSDPITGTSIEGVGTIKTNKGLDYLLESKIPTTALATTGYASTDAPVVDIVELGKNTYMEWGRWNITETFDYHDDTSQGVINNYAYYMKGNPTQVVPNLGNVTYSGAAGGTWWSTSGGINLTGTFTCVINNTTITGFDLDVVDNVTTPAYGAKIDNAGGTLSGGSFTITGGAWSLHTDKGNGVTPGETNAVGSMYGPGGDGVGGVWAMREGAVGVNGFFEGENGEAPSTTPDMPAPPVPENPDGQTEN